MNTQNTSYGKNIGTVIIADLNTGGELTEGKLLNPQKTSYPQAVHYNYSKNGHELLLSYNKPTPAEISSVANGEIELRLYVEKDIIDLVFRFVNGFTWADAPYNWHINPSAIREIPQILHENGGVILHITLIDSSTGIIKALRTVILSHEFTSKLFDAIQAQIQMPFNDSAYDEHLETMYRKFSPKELSYQSKVRMVVPQKTA